MELKQLRHFLAAAETESFSRGAERAFVSQPALSSSVAKLEDELGVELFVRSSRGVKLTAAGRRLIKTARAVIAECATAKRDIKDAHEGLVIRLGVSASLSADRVAALVGHYQSLHPSVKISVVDGKSKDLFTHYENGRLDLLITAHQDSQSGPEDEVIMFEEPYVVALPRGHQLSVHETIDLSMLHGEDFIARNHCDYRAPLTEAFRDAEIQPNVVFRTNSDDRAAVFISAGLGLAVVPEHFAAKNTVKRALRGEHKAFWRLTARDKNAETLQGFVKYALTANWLRA